ncbi:hypothetical protein CDO44_09815 [Pigmentiphaga sp. NML080357]|uniref:helix-turn-helix transcriptional regulator n=1 Tax=Pigmentiphaga sp. NML080357 TaxID=2008675 RepID=UPI000B416B13|nr:hypothetical protein [Pigmentiphaga sp. NML080357]OVZ60378.1 hypothetical protein CDO44_09815 [Pigmentiphaga sp. NML080357]
MGSIPSLETYDALVEHCYESVLDASRWPGLLEALVAASGRQSGAMAIRDPGQNQATVTASIRCDPTAIEAYNGHYGGIDPVRPWIATHEAGQWCHDRRDLGTGVVASHPYYREFQQAYGIDDRASIQLTGDGSRIYLAVLTAIGAQTDAAHDELLARIAPHLRRAGRMFDAMSAVREGLRQRERLLDGLPTPLWLLDDERRVAYRNAAAERYAALPDGALCEQGGYVRPRRTTTGRLESAIEQALARSGPARGGRIAPPSAGGAEILVAPLPDTHPDNPQERPLAVVSVVDPALLTLRLADLFQFSRAEARLAARLQAGCSLAEYAQNQGIALSTARTQLRALFVKTGTHRQGELVSLLLRLSRH